MLGHGFPGLSHEAELPAVQDALPLGPRQDMAGLPHKAGTGLPPSSAGLSGPGGATQDWGTAGVPPVCPRWSQALPQAQLLLAGRKDICATLAQVLWKVPEARHHPEASEVLAGGSSVCWELMAPASPASSLPAPLASPTGCHLQLRAFPAASAWHT